MMKAFCKPKIKVGTEWVTKGQTCEQVWFKFVSDFKAWVPGLLCSLLHLVFYIKQIVGLITSGEEGPGVS
jgi:hypothetical protein